MNQNSNRIKSIKTPLVILSIILVVSLIGNLYFFSNNLSITLNTNLLEQEVEMLRNDLNLLNVTFEGYKDTHSYSDSEYALLNLSSHIYLNTHTILDEEYENLQSQYDSLTATHENYVTEHSYSNSEYTSIENQVANLQNQINDLTTERESLMADVISIGEQRDDAIVYIETLEDQIEILENQIVELQNIIALANYTEHTQYELLGGGGRWAARDGETALYINWKDNWLNHSTTDGSDWWWSPTAETNFEILKNAVVQTLEDWGFQVSCAGDLPETLNGYDLVVIEAFYAVEPKHASLVEEYIANGGGVAILGGVPCYFSVYCKDMWPYRLGGMDLTPIQDWFGSSRYVNTGGIARTVVDNPVGTSLNADDIIVTTTSYSMAAMTQLNSNAEVIGTWDPGTYVYSYTYEYEEGRVFYQGGPFEIIPAPE